MVNSECSVLELLEEEPAIEVVMDELEDNEGVDEEEEEAEFVVKESWLELLAVVENVEEEEVLAIEDVDAVELEVVDFTEDRYSCSGNDYDHNDNDRNRYPSYSSLYSDISHILSNF